MEKITQIIFCAILFSLFSCGEKKEEQKDTLTTGVADTIKPVLGSEIVANDPMVKTVIETKDVKGVIKTTENVRISDSTITIDEGKFASAILEIADSVVVKIYPTKKSFSTLRSELIKQYHQKGTFQEIESTENSLLYRVTVDNKMPVYNFTIIIKGKSKQYLLTGEGKAPMRSIHNAAMAIKAYNTALSFVPAD